MLAVNRILSHYFTSASTWQPTRARCRNAVLEQLTPLLRDAYTDERRNWHRGRGGEVAKYRPGPQWDKAWPKMADFYLKHQIGNYRAYIHVQFTARGSLAVCPTPQQCYGPASLRRWQEHQPKKKDYELSLKLQMHKLEAECQRYRNWMPQWSEHEVQTMVLFDHGNTITALLRYCVALQVGRADIAAHYHDVSLMHYVFGQEVYNEVWGDLIPDVLKREAQQMCFVSIPRS